MKIKLTPIKLKEVSHNVSLLHQVLSAFDLSVSKTETTKHLAGESTLKQTRRLQKQLGLRVNNNSILLDQESILAIIKAMTDKGLLASNRLFNVSGTVKLSNGKIQKQQRLIAFDLDLRGVSIYRTLKTLKEAKRIGGFEFLGETATDNQGQYSLNFYDWQYKRAERNKADAVVYALSKKDEIIGHSRLVNTQDYSAQGFVSDLDLILVDNDQRTEYQALMDPLNIFLKQSETSLLEIAKSSEQISFTASELDVALSLIEIAAAAELLVQKEARLSHELLYAIARHDIGLSWPALYKVQQEDLKTAIATCIDDNIIQTFTQNKISEFIRALQSFAISHILDDKDDDNNNQLSDRLSNALPKKAQRVNFLKALNEFSGEDFGQFWETHLPEQSEFKNKPKLIEALKLTQQLTLLSGDHQPLIKALQLEKGIKTAKELIDFNHEEWLEVIRTAGTPDAIEGKDENEKQQHYAEILQNRINAEFPTQRITKMVKDNQLGIDSLNLTEKLERFLTNNEAFDISHSRVYDFKEEIEAAADSDDAEEVKSELMKIQRLFQISPNPEVFTLLLKNKLHSAHLIAGFPRENFVNTYGEKLGGKETAKAVHQRAEFISRRTEFIAMDVMQYSKDSLTPAMAISQAAKSKAEIVFSEKLPNYKNLFGSPDLCQCEHCRSVFSPAAYFVELLQFLEKSIFYIGEIEAEENQRSPYDYLVGGKDIELDITIQGRRPDLAELALSCENTNTLIPYIDLCNEVMEAYVANDSLKNYKGENTGDATVDELRANPQHTNIKAYKKLKDATYPFSLPFHQPLNVIRTYSDFLNVSRYDVMGAINSQTNDITIQKAVAAEALGLSHEEYTLLVGKDFNDTTDNTQPHEYFGYDAEDELEKLSPVHEFMNRSGIAYIDLVELIKTRFINPDQDIVDYFDKIFSLASLEGDSIEGNSTNGATIDSKFIHTWLGKAAIGQTEPEDDAKIEAALSEYNLGQETEEETISPNELKQWAEEHFAQLQQIITLFEPSSQCNLETTRLRTIQSVYEDPDTIVIMANLEEKMVLGASGIETDSWSKFHRFIRLWRKLGWSIHETDLILSVLGEDDIRPETIAKLESVLLLKKASKLPLNQLAALWGDIDTYGNKSLYKKLFLNKSNQPIDSAFEADAQGHYLVKQRDDQNEPITLLKHQSAILAAFRISEEELNVILNKAKINIQGNLRLIDFDNDILNLQNLSAIYRYVVLAKALKMRVTAVCKIIDLFASTPFNSPTETVQFYQLAASTKAARFKPEVLDYIFNDVLPTDSKIGLDKNKTLQTAKTIRDDFAVIEHDHPLVPESTLSSEIVSAKLSMVFQPEIVTRFMEIIEGAAIFKTQIDTNLGVEIPEDLKGKYRYIAGSGWFSCIGIMTNEERDKLKSFENNSNKEKFETAIDELYQSPTIFIGDNFKEVFDIDNQIPASLEEINKKLLDRSPVDPEVTMEDKLEYIYQSFLPLLKKHLKQDMFTTHIASLIGLSEEATFLLLAKDSETLIDQLSTQGFSASYFNNTNWETLAPPQPQPFKRTDSTINFRWENGSPNPNAVIADNFSVNWKSYIAAPSSGEYTLLIDVEEKDEVFNLYLDGELIISKVFDAEETSFEKTVNLDATQLHLLTLEYSEVSGEAGIRLSWKTATNELEIIPAEVAYPAHILDTFVQRANVLHRAAKFILGFKINETELSHFIRFKNDFSGIDFEGVNFEGANFEGASFEGIGAKHWLRIRDYCELRNSLPQSQALLTDVFTLANQSTPLPEMADLTELILQATGWDDTSLSYLTTHFNLSISDFKNEIAFNRILAVIKMTEKTGLAAETIAHWGNAKNIDFDKLHDTAKLLKNTVKAKYNDSQWLEIVSGLTDKIRENQKQSLISYLLVQESIKGEGVSDADGLFEHFLIDVQMGACMDTSRIVQANAAIQLFVNRILLNLEDKIAPDTIDTERWQWMKNYRVWEANRKVFLYPENWLEPEWREDRSEFFKELESHLLQNDITTRSVEQGLRNYLRSMNEVSNLDVCGLHQEDYQDGRLKYLHVFGRTNNLPYKYFYRRQNEYGKWSAWEKVQVDIRGVEDGVDSGVHLIPVVWKGRLILFWPEFMEMSRESEVSKKTSYRKRENRKPADFGPEKYWEIRLAWSEYVDSTWSPKQVSKEALKIDAIETDVFFGYRIIETEYVIIPRNIRINYHIDIISNELTFSFGHNIFSGWSFTFTNIHSSIKEDDAKCKCVNNDLTGFENFYTKTEFGKSIDGAGVLEHYLGEPSTYQILQDNKRSQFVFQKDTPFFFNDGANTYFVQQSGVFFERPVIPIQPKGNLSIASGWLPDNTGSRPTDNDIPLLATLPLGFSLFSPPSGNANSSLLDKGEGFYTCSAKYCYPSVKSSFAPILFFHTFYHPLSSQFVTRLNEDGIPKLMASGSTDINQSDEGAFFKDTYKPNFSRIKPTVSTLGKRTFYQENLCFDIYGANSLYNWELFFHAPLYIATRLSKNGKYEEAMKWFHYIFDPTTNEKANNDDDTARYWKLKPFKSESNTTESLQSFFIELAQLDPDNPNIDMIDEWLSNPFNTHLVASNRPIAYMKNVVTKYIENLINWGDSLFRQFTRESVYEAIQLYVIANHVLGKRPEVVPKRGDIKTETYASLRGKLDSFGNALVELENLFPYSSDVNVSSTSTGSNLLGIGSALYFCIPANDKLLEYWDTVTDRLFKIRHCQDLEGVERGLALFSPPIDPGALIQAQSQNLSLGNILANLNAPPPIYRFGFMLQKANEFCNDVKALGSAVLSVLEKKDGEELSRLRSSQEINMLERVTAIRERQVLTAKASIENLHKTRETAELRLEHYNTQLLGNDSTTVPDSPTLDATLTANSQLPKDTNISVIDSAVDMSLVDSDESGVKLIPREDEQLFKNNLVKRIALGIGSQKTVAAAFRAWPELCAYVAPLGTGLTTITGGNSAAEVIDFMAAAAQSYSNSLSAEASQASMMAGYIRRTHDWTLQANLVIREIIQLDKQITGADIQLQVAEKELQNHQQQIENSKQVELFLKNKFTNQELYQWMKDQLFSVYKQSYSLAFEMALQAEMACQYELGTESSNYIQYGYWNNSKEGLVSGEKLQLALRQLENSYLNTNRRELELSKSISLALLNPLALIELRETGKCYLSVPEELFDLDFQGHYFRRIKAVSLSIPCIAGPYTTVNCSLRLLKNNVRKNTRMNADFSGLDEYEHDNVDGLLLDDNRFRSSNVPVNLIATSTGQNDAGMFEFNFRDERYLPFEGAGVISDWMIELSTEKEFRQFDYKTISDIILHLKYTARESSGKFKTDTVNHLKNYLRPQEEGAAPLIRMFNLKQDFPTQWHHFLHPTAPVTENILELEMAANLFPMMDQSEILLVKKIYLLARCTKKELNYDVSINLPTGLEETMTLTSDVSFRGLHVGSKNITAEIDPENIPTWKLTMTRNGGNNLLEDEIEDVFMVLEYGWE